MPGQSQNKKKIILGLTGSFGSGKSTAARIFKAFGARVIDADKLAHRFLRPGTKTYRKIINIFGRNILKKNRAIDRAKLAEIVFAQKNLLKRLDNIIHPPVIKQIKNQIKAAKAKIIVLDAPLLIEAGLSKMVDKLLVVKINKTQQFRRLRNKLSLSRQAILIRIKAQIPLSVKARLADFVIDNSGTIEETRKQITKIRRQLWKN